MSFINKIAKLITEDPDLFSETDETLRNLERAEGGDREAYLASRRQAERSQSKGLVSVDDILSFYMGLDGIGDPREQETIDVTSEYYANRKQQRYVLADYLMDYAPNFKRSAIGRLINCVESWHENLRKLEMRRLDLHSIEINHPSSHLMDLVDYYGLEQVRDNLLAYIDMWQERTDQSRARLESFIDKM